jgi:hypothetical protein
MKTVLLFAVMIAAPLVYLGQHARCFRLYQEVARLQEQKQRQREICDSLAACLGNAGSRITIANKALALGLVPDLAFGPVPQPVPAIETGKSVAMHGSKSSAKGHPGIASTRRLYPAAKSSLASQPTRGAAGKLAGREGQSQGGL